MLPDWLNQFLYSVWFVPILMLGAFADAFIGTGLFVLGEIFFVAGGYMFALTGNWWLFPLIWLAALVGDLASYFIGIYYGERIIRRFIRKGKRRRLNYLRARRIMQTKGGMAIFTARITGPVAKFMPFLAGSMNLPFKTVFIASFWGVILGTIQFFFIGFFLAQGLNYWDVVWNFIKDNPIFSALTGILLLSFCVFGWKYYRRKKRLG